MANMLEVLNKKLDEQIKHLADVVSGGSAKS